MKYWKQGFYDEPIDGSVEITEEHYQELLVGQSAGLLIAESQKGYPILVVHEATIEETRAQNTIAKSKNSRPKNKMCH